MTARTRSRLTARSLSLRGGVPNGDAMSDTIGGPLGDTYRVSAFDRRGHGRTTDTSEPFHCAAMAGEMIASPGHLGGLAHLTGLRVVPSPPGRISSRHSRTAIEVRPGGLIWDRLINTFGSARNLRDVLGQAPELVGHPRGCRR